MVNKAYYALALIFTSTVSAQQVTRGFNLSCTLSSVGKTNTFILDFAINEGNSRIYYNGESTRADIMNEQQIKFMTNLKFGDPYYTFLINRTTGSIQVMPALYDNVVATGRCEKAEGRKF